MKIKDARDAYYFYSGKTSDIVRQLSLAGIAVIWLFRIPTGAATHRVPHDLVIPGILVMGALAADLLQYAVAAGIWGVYSYRKEQAALNSDAEFRVPDALNWPALVLFWLKVVLVIVAYVLIVRFLWDVVLPAPAAPTIPQLRGLPE